MTSLYVFNPEHDLALAVGKGSYTAPAQIIDLKEKMSLLPAKYAGHSDFILVPDSVSPSDYSKLKYFDIAASKHLNLVSLEQLSSNGDKIDSIKPWGWDHAVVNLLRETGIKPELIPTDEEISRLRELSHRRTTIPFLKETAKYLKKPPVNLPTEIFDEQEIPEFLEKHPVAFFKAPWSSSGRGIVVSDHISQKGLMEWAHGVIKKQGSLIAEPAWDKSLDFATEWWIKDGEPLFLGVSVFEASSRGKYHQNLELTQSVLYLLIEEAIGKFLNNCIDAQHEALKNIIAPYYDGPLGIDMLADKAGNVNPCVEINLRMTMGLVPLLS